MSLFGSMTTAISGMTAQSRALGHISENVSNSQTIGFKRIDTAFENMLTLSASKRLHLPGSVVARPEATNDLQGAVEQVENPLALAISGQGFFSVARRNGANPDGTPSFDGRQIFSRAGDFQRDLDGYLVNSVGDSLQGWPMREDGTLDATRLVPIQVTNLQDDPKPTTTMKLSANLPATPDGSSMVTETSVHDRLGTLHPMQLSWTRLADERWRVDVSAPDAVTPAIGSIEVLFGGAAGNGTAPGTIGGFANPTGALAGSGFATGGPAEVTFPVTFGTAANPLTQPVKLDLGRFGSSDGVTQFAGSRYEMRGLVQDGAPAGAFSSVVIREDGNVVVNFDNGQNRTIAKVPVVTFANPDALERLDGQAFEVTLGSGNPRVLEAGSNGAGALAAGAVERSNVDMAAEFSKLIVAQRAYTANTRIVTASDEMLQDTINMRR